MSFMNFGGRVPEKKVRRRYNLRHQQRIRFDYLRDNIAYNVGDVVQKTCPLRFARLQRYTQRFKWARRDAGGGYNFAIVGEIDSILIDEARTPLIISAPSADLDQFYIMFSKIAEKWIEGKDYTLDEKMKAISLTEEGIEKSRKSFRCWEYLHGKRHKISLHHLETAIRAKALSFQQR